MHLYPSMDVCLHLSLHSPIMNLPRAQTTAEVLCVVNE